MKQLKLDAFVSRTWDPFERDRVERLRDRVQQERSVLQAFAEYEDISQNVYVPRPHKNPIVDIACCRCRPCADWTLSCVFSCENQATQTECVKGYCATKNGCGNQRMQRGVQATLALESILGKGIALAADMQIEQDGFIAQYVGEVISRKMYLERELKEAHRYTHTYGLAVTTDEVIDARHFGGIARFANHSCSPNCTIERWEVAGETCYGLFAKHVIHRGQEITFEYGNEFVQPEKRKKCLCRSVICTGFM